jgi:hypothetical protein
MVREGKCMCAEVQRVAGPEERTSEEFEDQTSDKGQVKENKISRPGGATLFKRACAPPYERSAAARILVVSASLISSSRDG